MFKGIKYKQERKRSRSRSPGISQMMREEKNTTSQDYNRNLVRNFKQDQQSDFDSLLENYNTNSLNTVRPRSQKVRLGCKYCSEEEKFIMDNLAYWGDQFYISIPYNGSLTPGHCIIVPIKHMLSLRECEINEYQQLQHLQRQVVQLNRSKLRKETIFVETVKDLSRCKHTILHCYPVKPRHYEEADLMIYKELSEADEEWTQNKRVIDTKAGLLASIPSGFPYIHFEFGTGGGYAHIIESTRHFRGDLGREVLAELVGVELFNRKRRFQPEELAVMRRELRGLWQGRDGSIS